MDPLYFYTKLFLVVLYNLIGLNIKYHEDPSVHCGDICITILILIINFLSILHNFNFGCYVQEVLCVTSSHPMDPMIPSDLL